MSYFKPKPSDHFDPPWTTAMTITAGELTPEHIGCEIVFFDPDDEPVRGFLDAGCTHFSDRRTVIFWLDDEIGYRVLPLDAEVTVFYTVEDLERYTGVSAREGHNLGALAFWGLITAASLLALVFAAHLFGWV